MTFIEELIAFGFVKGENPYEDEADYKEHYYIQVGNFLYLEYYPALPCFDAQKNEHNNSLQEWRIVNENRTGLQEGVEGFWNTPTSIAEVRILFNGLAGKSW